jgi:hypothetical protein
LAAGIESPALNEEGDMCCGPESDQGHDETQDGGWPPSNGRAPADDHLLYDEDGSLTLARARARSRSAADEGPACPVKALNGSWYLHFVPDGPHVVQQIRGPMRIEVARPRLRVSGDVYVGKRGVADGEVLRPILESAILFGRNWYPQLPLEQYAWYFRSVGVEYANGKLVFKFERRLWSQTTQEFVSSDNGWMEFECRGVMTEHPSLPAPALTISGKAQVGGTTYRVVATRTSPLYRGCRVEVDVMTNRTWPVTAATCAGAELTFTSIYRTAGWDCPATVDQTTVPEDPQLTTAELHTALASHLRRDVRRPGPASRGRGGLLRSDAPQRPAHPDLGAGAEAR